MDVNSTGKAVTCDPRPMSKEGKLLNEYLVNWGRVSMLIPGKWYNGCATIDICVEYDWLTMVNGPYMETQLYLP